MAAVVGLSVLLSSRQQPLYQASAQVLLKHQSLASGLSGLPDTSTVDRDPVRIAQTQTQIAMSPAVAERVVSAAGLSSLDAGSFLDRANVTARPDADILNFQVTYADPAIASRLATTHAQAFVAHRKQLDTAALVTARNELRGRIKELQAGAFRNSDLVARLVETEQELQTMEALQTANASLLRAAPDAIRVQPRTARNVVLGVVLGLMLGIALVLALDAVDTRIRSSSELSARLELPMLARLAAPPRKIRARNQLVMLSEPQGPRAEAFRMLRSNLDFANLDRGARSIMVSSAIEREGKSTTVANLALAFARGGRRVALVDLDLRKPLIGTFFDIDRAHPGVTSIVFGRSTAQDAMVEVFRSPTEPEERSSARGNGDGRDSAAPQGCLRVLAAGTPPEDPGEFVSDPRLGHLLDELSEAYDLVLIDTPPLLPVGDATALSSKVDAIVVVTSLTLLKRPIVEELARALSTCPTVKLGFVVTGAEADQVIDRRGYTSGYYYGRGHGYTVRTRRETDRGETLA
jgi:polysaccharide biosynthesis transport protein